MNQNREFPYVLATPQHRLAGRALEIGFYIVTFGIGWFIWNLIVWTDGQTPGHQVLKMRIFSIDTKKPASWGHMALRQFVLPLAYVIIPFILIIAGAAMTSNDGNSGAAFIISGYVIGLGIGLTDIFWIFKGEERQRLVDKFARTVVLNECKKAELLENGFGI